MATEPDPADVKDFIKGVYEAISTDKPKVVIVVSDDDEDPEAMKFQVLFDPPYDNKDQSANPEVYGVAGAFIAYVNKLMGNEDDDDAA